jgi:hypothetical protein
VQRVQRPQPPRLDQRPQRAERGVGLAAAHLHPGQQHRLQHLHRAAAAEAAQPLLRPLPAPGHQGGEEGAVQQLGLLGIGAQGRQQVVRGGAGVGLGGGEASGEVGPEGTAQRRAAGELRPARGGAGGTAGGAGGEERGREERQP